jgi:hypothetical protein
MQLLLLLLLAALCLLLNSCLVLNLQCIADSYMPHQAGYTAQ